MTGVVKSVSIWLNTRPPTIAIPSGRRSSDPVPVPSAEEQIQRCVPLTAEERFQCWADLDRYLMEDVVPWVPKTFLNQIDILSARVTSYSFDEFGGLAALDRLAVEEAA